MRLAGVLLALLLLAACGGKERSEVRPVTNAVIDSLLERAYSLEDSSRYVESLTCLREVLTAATQLNDSATLCDCQLDLSSCYQRLGDLTSAIEASEQALQLSTLMGDAPRQSSAYNNLS